VAYLNTWILRLLVGSISVLAAVSAVPGAANAQGQFQLSFAAGLLDRAGRFMGGTEVRILTAYAGKL
jgi:hypothetical protein